MTDEKKAPRFRISTGSMLVIPTAEEPETRPVRLIFDAENNYVGIMLIGESPVKGYVFLVPFSELLENMKTGKPTHHLRY